MARSSRVTATAMPAWLPFRFTAATASVGMAAVTVVIVVVTFSLPSRFVVVEKEMPVVAALVVVIVVCVVVTVVAMMGVMPAVHVDPSPPQMLQASFPGPPHTLQTSLD